jgi:hypothetical protein
MRSLKIERRASKSEPNPLNILWLSLLFLLGDNGSPVNII